MLEQVPGAEAGFGEASSWRTAACSARITKTVTNTTTPSAPSTRQSTEATTPVVLLLLPFVLLVLLFSLREACGAVLKLDTGDMLPLPGLAALFDHPAVRNASAAGPGHGIAVETGYRCSGRAGQIEQDRGGGAGDLLRRACGA